MKNYNHHTLPNIYFDEQIPKEEKNKHIHNKCKN